MLCGLNSTYQLKPLNPQYGDEVGPTLQKQMPHLKALLALLLSANQDGTIIIRKN